MTGRPILRTYRWRYSWSLRTTIPISQKHIAEFFALLGGGVKEPGWMNTQLSKSRLAVVSGYSHYNFTSSPEVPQIIHKFLYDQPANPQVGTALASQVVVPEHTQ